MQVDPIKPTLKAPGTKRLRLEHVEMLSSFAFNSDLRRFLEAAPCDFFELLGRG